MKIGLSQLCISAVAISLAFVYPAMGGGVGVGGGGGGGSAMLVPAPTPAASAKVTSWVGTLSAPNAGAPATVIAVLSVNGKTYQVTSADPMLTLHIKGLLGKTAAVQVKGDLSKDGNSIVATKCDLKEAGKDTKPAATTTK